MVLRGVFFIYFITGSDYFLTRGCDVVCVVKFGVLLGVNNNLCVVPYYLFCWYR